MVLTERAFFFSFSSAFLRTSEELRAILFPSLLLPPHLIKAGNSGALTP